MRIINIVLMFSVILMGSTCEKENTEDCHYYIEFLNNSDKDVYVSFYLDYPDTLDFRNEPNPASSPEIFKVKAGKENENSLSWNDCWEAYFASIHSPTDTIMVFVFDSQVLENTPWDTVAHYYMVLERYDLSLEDLENLDWRLTYP